tara:strand:- start:1722 stop:1937 length:216 start_codon:yes stop_codon:yes gene_type:complete
MLRELPVRLVRLPSEVVRLRERIVPSEVSPPLTIDTARFAGHRYHSMRIRLYALILNAPRSSVSASLHGSV